MTTRILLLPGMWNADPASRPASPRKMASKATWTTPPASTFSPTPVTASAGGTPDFWRYRTLRAMPPTFAGVTRLTNEDASDTCVVGTSGSRWRVVATMPIPLDRYVHADIATAPASHIQFADRSASTLSSTLASCGSRM